LPQALAGIGVDCFHARREVAARESVAVQERPKSMRDLFDVRGRPELVAAVFLSAWAVNELHRAISKPDFDEEFSGWAGVVVI
tara:strand:+ start:2708 stop:2956 length:249 start_codon:yes stop_codon:yes gene_type:complete